MQPIEEGVAAPVAVFAALGLMAKPMVVTLPFALLLDLWPLGRLGQTPTFRSIAAGLPPLVREKASLFALSAVITYAVQSGAGSVAPIDELRLGTRLANAAVSYIAYLGKMFWPVELAVIYPYRTESLTPVRVALAAATLLLLTVVALQAGRRRGFPAVGWLWYLGTLVPVIGIVQVGNQGLADRYTYVSLLGIFIIAAWCGAEGTRRLPRGRVVAAVGAVACLIAIAGATRAQVRTWRDAATVFAHAAAVVPGNHLAENSLGVALAGQGRMPEAIERFEKAILAAPAYAPAFYNLGVQFAAQGRFEEATSWYGKALTINSRYASAHNNLGSACLALGRVPDARREFEAALRLDPGLPEAHGNLGNLLLDEAQVEQALAHFSTALAGGVSDPKTLANAGLALSKFARFGEAEPLLRRALAGEPGLADARANLGAVLLELGRPQEAAVELAEAIRIRPGSATAQNNFGNALASIGRPAEALERYAEVIRLKPANAEAHNNLGVTLFELGRVAESIASFRCALEIWPDYPDARRNLERALGAVPAP